MEQSLHQNRRNIFQNCRHNHAADIEQQNISGDGLQNQIDDDSPEAIDGADRTGHKASIDQFLLLYGYVGAFPEPSQEAIDIKPVDDMVNVHACNLYIPHTVLSPCVFHKIMPRQGARTRTPKCLSSRLCISVCNSFLTLPQLLPRRCPHLPHRRLSRCSAVPSCLEKSSYPRH